jgi:prephenate dehydratase
VPGAWSQLAAQRHQTGCQTLGLPDFDAVVKAVVSGKCDRAMLPVSNTVVGDIAAAQQAIAAATNLEVVAQLDLRITHCLMALPGADLASLRWAESHPVALAQCARWLSARRLTPRSVEDTAGAARNIASDRDWTRAAVAPPGAAELYGLTVISHDIGDAAEIFTTFIVLARIAQSVAA